MLCATPKFLTSEVVGIDEDTELLAYFRRHYAHFFPNLTTFTSQAAYPCGRPRSSSGRGSWPRLLTTPSLPWRTLSPAGVSVRPGPPLKGEAAFGKDALLKQTFYGFRVHARVCWPGVITRFSVAPANAHELSVLPERTSGLLVGDRNYHSPTRPRRSWRA
jgi:hypothetical protein